MTGMLRAADSAHGLLGKSSADLIFGAGAVRRNQVRHRLASALATFFR